MNPAAKAPTNLHRLAAFALCAFALACAAALAPLASTACAETTRTPIGTVQAFQDETGLVPIDSEGAATVYDGDESRILSYIEYCSKLSVKCVTINMSKDWNTKDAGRILVPEGMTLRIYMHGHMLDRGMFKQDGQDLVGSGSGEVIHLKKNSRLFIDGGTDEENAATSHKGYLEETCYRYEHGNVWRHDDNGNVTITGSLITGGFCDDKYGGGGISSEGTGVYISLLNVTVAGNFSDEYGLLYGNGGGIAIHGADSTLKITNSTISYNGADSCGAGVYVRDKNCSVTVSNSTFYSNYAVSDGGGIYIDEDSTSLTVEKGSVFENNRTRYNGGGIYMDGDGELSLKDSKFLKNIATDEGGAVFINEKCTFTIDNCELTENEAGDYGGAIMHNASDGSFTIKNSKLLKNKAYGLGGAICDWYDGTTINIEGCKINENKVCYYTYSSRVSEDLAGGGIHLEDKATLNVKDTEIRDNTSDGYGGGISVTEPSTITLDGCSIRGNSAGAYSGGGIAFYPNSVIGSAGECTLNLKNNTSIFANLAKRGYGGGIYGRRYSLNIYGDGTSSITSNQGVYGGGIGFNSETAYTQKLTVDNVKVNDNSASYGGGIYLNRSECTLRDVEIILNNGGDADGGGLYVASDQYYALTFERKVVIDRNIRSVYGVARSTKNVYLENAKQTICGGSGENALSADSRIGVTANGSDGETMRQVSGNSAFLTNFTSDAVFEKAFYSDSPNCKAVKKDGHLYLDSSQSTSFNVSIVTNRHTTTKSSGQNATITLNTSDYASYAPTDKTIVAWKIESTDGSSSYLKAYSGSVSFRMPPCTTTATAVYGDQIADVKINLLDATSDWNRLGNDNKSVKINSLEITGSNGKKIIVPASVLASKASIPNADEDKSEGACTDETRKSTYKVVINASLLEDYGLGIGGSGSVNIDTSISTVGFGDGTVEDTKITANDSSATLEFTVTYTKPAINTAVKVTCVNMNDESSAAISYTEVAFGDEESVKVTAPEVEGWSFDSWGTLPAGAAENEDGSLTVTKSAADIALTAKYKPKASAIAVQVAVPASGSAGADDKLESCKLVDSAQIQDVTNAVNKNVSITWDTTGEDTDKVTITTKLNTSSLGCLISSDTAAAVNGIVGTLTVDNSAGTQTLTAEIPAQSDKRFDSLTTQLDDVTLYGSDGNGYADYLPSTVEYCTKDGSTLSAIVSWETTDVDASQNTFTVKGSFVDAVFSNHEVSRSFTVEPLRSAPATSTEGAIHEATEVSFGQNVDWGSPSKITYHYYVAEQGTKADDISKDAYTTGDKVTVDKTCTLLTYATLEYAGEGGAQATTTETAVGSYNYILKIKHNLKVTGGSAYTKDSRSQAASEADSGDEVDIEATAPSGMVFDKWVVVAGNVELKGGASEVRNSFTMPDSDVELCATFKPADDDSDDGDDPQPTPDPDPTPVPDHETASAPSNQAASVVYKDCTYTLESGKLTLSEVNKKSLKTVTIPAKIKINGKKVKVTKVKAKAFAGTKVTKVIVKSPYLTKKSVKSCFKSSKVKTVKVKTRAGKKGKAKLLKKYKRCFAKANSGKKATVK